MPKAVDIDWPTAEALYQEGLSFVKIAERLKCNAATLRSRALRAGWRDKVAKARELMQQDNHYWQERAQTWPRRVAALMEKRMTYLERIPVEDLSMKELKELSSTTKETNEMAREAYGLNDQKPATFH